MYSLVLTVCVKIDVHYSLPRPDDQAKGDPKEHNQVRNKNGTAWQSAPHGRPAIEQGTLIVTLRNSPSGQPIDDTEVHRLFGRFGDIKNIKPGDNPHE